MPAHHFVCRQCGTVKVIHSSITNPSPEHPYCTDCHRTFAKQFGFSHTAMDIEIHSPNVGKHGSTRSYRTALDRLSDVHSERVGMEVNYESFSKDDKDMSPVDPS